MDGWWLCFTGMAEKRKGAALSSRTRRRREPGPIFSTGTSAMGPGSRLRSAGTTAWGWSASEPRIDPVSCGPISLCDAPSGAHWGHPTRIPMSDRRSYIIDDRERKTFLLDREVLVSEDILRREMSQIFGR